MYSPTSLHPKLHLTLTDMAGGDIDKAFEERSQRTVFCGLKRQTRKSRLILYTCLEIHLCISVSLLTASSSSLVGELGTSST